MSDEGVDETKRATLRRFAALGTAGPLARFATSAEAAEEPDERSGSDARDAIVGYLSTTPGAHFSKIRDDLQLGTGEAQYHLRQLVEESVVESHEDGDYRRFFPAGRFDPFERTALSYLRRDTVRGMVLTLLSDPGATGSDIADALGVSRPTVSKYAAELDEVGLLSREDGYSITEPETLLLLVVRYADSFDEAAVAFAEDAASLVAYDP
jgi:predicted transcriptional regulator